MAHIDAGKTTTTERILYYTGLTHKIGEVHEGTATMDWMEQEQERGITITAASTTCYWREHRINIIDTPGHVDFSYEVSRSLAACQGALLIVDASQGVEAQTLANAHLASDAGLEIIPILNKIDLPGAEPERAREQIEHVIGIDASDAIECSAKKGIGIDEILDRSCDTDVTGTPLTWVTMSRYRSPDRQAGLSSSSSAIRTPRPVKPSSASQSAMWSSSSSSHTPRNPFAATTPGRLIRRRSARSVVGSYRHTDSTTFSPDTTPAVASSRSRSVDTRCPLTSVITSPSCSPASNAGLFTSTRPTVNP